MGERYQRIPAIFDQLGAGNCVYGPHPEYGDKIVTQFVMARTHKQIVLRDSHFNVMYVLSRVEFDGSDFGMAYNAKGDVLENTGCAAIHNRERRYSEAIDRLNWLSRKACQSWPDCTHAHCKRYAILQAVIDL